MSVNSVCGADEHPVSARNVPATAIIASFSWLNDTIILLLDMAMAFIGCCSQVIDLIYG